VKFKNMFMLMIVVLIGIVIAGCSGASDEGSVEGSGGGGSESDSLTIYTAFPEEEAINYINGFEEETGINVDFVRLSAGETLARLKAEESNTQAAIWYGGPSDRFVAAANEDLIEPYQPEGIDDIPEEFIDEDGNWSPIYVGALGFAVSQEWIEDNNIDAPTSWEDLLKDEYKGEISMAHPSASVTAYTVLASLVQLLGEDEAFEYMKELDGNMRQYTKSGSAPAQNAGLGETGVGIAFSHDILAPMNEGYSIDLEFPNEGTGYEVGAVALVKNGPEDQEENAKAFIDWAVSKEGQDLYDESESFRLPVHPESSIPEGAVEITDIETIDYDAVQAGEDRDELLDRFDKEIRGEDAAEE